MSEREVIHGLSFDEYRAIDAVNWSRLKHMAKSPAHFAAETETEPTPAMVFGSAVHCAVLEPDRFLRDYVLWEGGRRYGKEWDAFCDANAGKIALPADTYETVLAIRDAIRRHEIARDWLRGDSEVTVVWTDDETGVKCKCRVDHVNEDGFFDLKTTKSVDAWEFQAHAARMLYHSQMAFYARAWAFTEYPRILAVETNPPFDIAPFRFTEDAMVTGDVQVSDLLARYARCEREGVWPGRYSSEQELGLPTWMIYDPEDAGEIGLTVSGRSV